jgi:hypothetical protein
VLPPMFWSRSNNPFCFKIDFEGFRSADGGKGGSGSLLSSGVGNSLYSVELDQPTLFRTANVFGEAAGDSAEESGVMDEGFFEADSPYQKRLMNPAFPSFRFDSRGGVGGLAGSVGSNEPVGDGSTMAASSRACGEIQRHRVPFPILTSS